MERTKQGQFSWVDLAAKDLEAQTGFYEHLFGWTHTDEPAGPDMIYRMFNSNGDVVAGAGQMTPQAYPPGTPSMWNTYVAVDDADAVASKASELGGSVPMPAMDVMEEGRMAVIQDPSGGMLGLWQSRHHKGATKFTEPVSITWNDLSTRDMNTAADFYEKLLGWSIERDGGSQPPYWQITVDGEPEGGIMPMPEQLPAEVPPHWMIYFAVDDVRATTEKVRQLGGNVEMEPMEAGQYVFSVISDPAGAVFAVMQVK